MKSPKPSPNFYYRKLAKQANAGCRECPNCGETRLSIWYLKRGKEGNGIVKSSMAITWREGLFRRRKMARDLYQCKTCGAQWESNPYPYREKRGGLMQ